MPELPEVQTVVSDLAEFLKNHTIREIALNDKKVWFESELSYKNYENSKIQLVTRYGKYIVIKTDKGDLLIHLRMTGKILPADHHKIPDGLIQSNSKQIRAKVVTSAGELIFYDTRRFGTISGVKDFSILLAKKKLAPEIYIDGGLLQAKKHFINITSKSSKKIKALLLDQTVILGPGNIYADEALHLSLIHPETAASKLTTKQANELFMNVVNVMNVAIKKRGTTAKDYLDFNGKPGIFKKYLMVYGRVGDPCKTCKKTSIQKIKVSGRSSHFCSNCQRYAAN